MDVMTILGKQPGARYIIKVVSCCHSDQNSDFEVGLTVMCSCSLHNKGVTIGDVVPAKPCTSNLALKIMAKPSPLKRISAERLLLSCTDWIILVKCQRTSPQLASNLLLYSYTAVEGGDADRQVSLQ